MARAFSFSVDLHFQTALAARLPRLTHWRSACKLPAGKGGHSLLSFVESAANSPSPPLVEELQDNSFLRFLVRIRFVLFALLALALLASFNGQWRVGRDSALYCDVARNLAEGKGYTFRGEREHHVYPGLPLLLAATQKVFGPQDPLHPTALLVLMMLMGAATLIVIYHLTLAYYPPWVAVCVTTGVGINKLFLEHSNELMTDVPFLLGVCLTLLGLAKLSKAQSRRSMGVAIVLAVIGGLLALSMRPTVWALAAAFLAACLVGLVRSPHKKQYAIGLFSFVAIVLGWLVLDPRLRGHLFNGRYEASIGAHLSFLGSDRWANGLLNTFTKHIPDAFFGFWAHGPVAILLAAVSLLLVAGSALLMRKSVLMGLYVLATISMILLLGSVPRYFLMVLPLFLIEWALLMHSLSRPISALIPWRFTADWVMLVGLAFPTVANVGQSVNFVLEQHGREIVIGDMRGGRHGGISQLVRGHWAIEQKPFLEVYRGGKMLAVLNLADQLAQIVPADERILAPEPRILSYVSRRAVFDTADLLGNKRGDQWVGVLRKKGLSWCAWGPRFPEELRLITALRKRLIEVEAGPIRPRDKRPWITIESIGRDPITREHAGMFVARMHARTPAGQKPATPVIMWKHLPGIDLKYYVKDKRPPAKAPAQPAATAPTTRPVHRTGPKTVTERGD
jgi:hypothetical protein